MKKILVTIIALSYSCGSYAQLDGSVGIKFKPVSGDYNLIRSYNAEYEDLTFDTRYPLVFSTITTGAFEFINHLGTELFAIKGIDGTTFFKGDIGIGIINPSAKLHVSDVSGEFTLGRPGSEMNHRLTIDANGGYENQLYFRRQVGRIFTGGKNLILGISALSSNLVVTSAGNIGVGTSNTDPNAGLHMYQNRYTLYGPNSTWNEYLQVGGNGRVTSHASVVATNGNLHLDSKEGKSLYLNHYSLGNTYLNPQGGQVGIGTTSVGTHKLAVEGTIGAREIKVEASGWSDFVFENDYTLRTLEEVEQHINENGHLPEIPSEAEVTENGINLGEMNAKLLQKIEELTLYMIDMNKEVKQLKSENQELNEKAKNLENE